jgi:hypothetical protein
MKRTMPEPAAVRVVVKSTTTFDDGSVQVVTDSRTGESYDLRSRRVRVWITHRLFTMTSTLPSPETVAGILDALEGRALFEEAA